MVGQRASLAHPSCLRARATFRFAARFMCNDTREKFSFGSQRRVSLAAALSNEFTTDFPDRDRASDALRRLTRGSTTSLHIVKSRCCRGCSQALSRVPFNTGSYAESYHHKQIICRWGPRSCREQSAGRVRSLKCRRVLLDCLRNTLKLYASLPKGFRADRRCNFS